MSTKWSAWYGIYERTAAGIRDSANLRTSSIWNEVFGDGAGMRCTGVTYRGSANSYFYSIAVLAMNTFLLN